MNETAWMRTKRSPSLRKRGLFSFASLLIALTLACVTSVLPAGAASSTSSESVAKRMVRMVNELRVARGLPALAISSSLQEGSERWSVNMAIRGAIFHNENLGDEIEGAWVRVGENVGRGPSVEDVQVAFSTSASHLENLLDPRWDAMAVGIVKSSDGLLYVTQRFKDQPAETPVVQSVPTAPPVPTTQPAPSRTSRRVRVRR